MKISTFQLGSTWVLRVYISVLTLPQPHPFVYHRAFQHSSNQGTCSREHSAWLSKNMKLLTCDPKISMFQCTSNLPFTYLCVWHPSWELPQHFTLPKKPSPLRLKESDPPSTTLKHRGLEKTHPSLQPRRAPQRISNLTINPAKTR